MAPSTVSEVIKLLEDRGRVVTRTGPGGGVFVAEAGSVLIQRGWFKYTRLKYGQGRRFFLMAPVHHHFQKLGWHESQVVNRFYILCVLCAVLALSTLKIR